MEERFDTLWNEKLQPWLLELETERRAAVRNYWAFFFAALALFAGAAFVLGALDDDLFGLVFMLGIPAFLIWVIGLNRLNKVRKRVKQELNTQIAQACGLRYRERPYELHRFDMFKEFGLIPHHNRRSFEDHFSGQVLGCDFDLYEAELKQRRRSKNRTYYVTVFRGVLIRINSPRKVEGVAVITRDQGWFNSLHALGRSFGPRKLERIGLVDSEFEKQFEVYGDDQVLARYMLTPTFMEQLLELEMSLKGKKIRAAFDADLGQGELLVAVETGNLFEAGSMFKPLADQGRIKSIIDEIGLVTRIIEGLVERPGARAGD